MRLFGAGLNSIRLSELLLEMDGKITRNHERLERKKLQKPSRKRKREDSTTTTTTTTVEVKKEAREREIKSRDKEFRKPNESEELHAKRKGYEVEDDDEDEAAAADADVEEYVFLDTEILHEILEYLAPLKESDWAQYDDSEVYFFPNPPNIPGFRVFGKILFYGCADGTHSLEQKPARVSRTHVLSRTLFLGRVDRNYSKGIRSSKIPVYATLVFGESPEGRVKERCDSLQKFELSHRRSADKADREISVRQGIPSELDGTDYGISGASFAALCRREGPGQRRRKFRR